MMGLRTFVKKVLFRFRGLFKIGKKFYVFGDSHTEVFTYINSIKKEEFFKIVRVEGATALGMVNPNSKTNALEIFNLEIAKIPKRSRLIFLLGEVDVGFLLWYRSIKMNCDIRIEMEKSISNYIAFLLKLKLAGFRRVYVMSPSPPCILDDFIQIQNNKLRREIEISLVERIRLATDYNRTLKERVTALGFGFLDVLPSMIDDQTKEVKSEFLRLDKKDHHLESSTYAKLVLEKINLL
jgi:hypothetical protein